MHYTKDMGMGLQTSVDQSHERPGASQWDFMGDFISGLRNLKKGVY